MNCFVKVHDKAPTKRYKIFIQNGSKRHNRRRLLSILAMQEEVDAYSANILISFTPLIIRFKTSKFSLPLLQLVWSLSPNPTQSSRDRLTHQPRTAALHHPANIAVTEHTLLRTTGYANIWV